MFNWMKVGFGLGFGLLFGYTLGERCGKAVCDWAENVTKQKTVEF